MVVRSQHVGRRGFLRREKTPDLQLVQTSIKESSLAESIWCREEALPAGAERASTTRRGRGRVLGGTGRCHRLRAQHRRHDDHDDGRRHAQRRHRLRHRGFDAHLRLRTRLGRRCELGELDRDPTTIRAAARRTRRTTAPPTRTTGSPAPRARRASTRRAGHPATTSPTSCTTTAIRGWPSRWPSP